MAGPFYWVGGTGNWSDATNHWATIDGGAPNVANVPDSTSDVHFTAASNTTAYTVTVDATANCKDLMFDAAPSVSGTITLAGSAALNVYGSLLLLAGMTRTYSGALTFAATTTGKTITRNAVSLANNFTFNGAGGGWAFQDSFTTSGSITLTAGALDLNSKATQCFIFSTSGASTRSLTFGTATFTVTGGGGGWSASGSNFSITDATGTIVMASSGTVFIGGGFSYPTYSPSCISGTAINGANTFVNLNLIGSAVKTDSVSLGANQTVTGTFKYLGNSATNRLLIKSDTLGTARTITAAAIDAASDFCDFMDITGAGAAAPFATGTSLGDALGNSGITFTAAADQYWYTTTTGTKTWSTAGNWFLGSGGTGGAGRVPLPQDNAIFNASSIGAAGTTINADMPRAGKDITWTGVTNTPTLNHGAAQEIYGSLTYASGMTITLSNGLTFRARSPVTFDSAGKTLASSWTVATFGSTLTLSSAFTGSGNLSITSGTLNDGGYSITAGGLLPSGTGSQVRTTTWTITGTTYQYSGTGTVTDSGTIKLTDATATTKTFAGGGKTYNNIWLSGAGSGSFNFTGANTFADLKVDNLPKDIRFTAATNTTIGSFTNADVPVADKFVRYPSGAGPYVSQTPDSVANSITDKLTGIVAIKAPSYALDFGIVGKGLNGVLSFVFIMSGDRLYFRASVDGSATAAWNAGASSSTTAGLVAGTITWLRFEYDTTSGDVTFWKAAFVDISTVPTAWTKIGATVAYTASPMYDGIGNVFVGGYYDAGGNSSGVDIYRVRLYQGLQSTSTEVLKVDHLPNDWTTGNTWTSSTTGEVWTRNGSALIYPEIKISSITAATHTLTKSGGGTVQVWYGNITNSIASPATTFYAPLGTNGGGNTNWTFGTAPVSVAATGVAGTAAAGSLGVSFAVATAGVAATGAAGVFGVGMTVPIVGVEGTGAAGTLTPIPFISLALTGVGAVTGIGTLGVNFAFGLTGVAGTGYAGAVSLPVNGALVREKSPRAFMRPKSNKVFLRTAAM